MNARCYGCNFTLDLGDGVESNVFWERYEDDTLRAWLAHVHASGTVFDVGANIGVFSLVAARRGARVFAFEPNPATFGRLRANLRANEFGRLVVADPRALSDSDGVATLYDDVNASRSLRNSGVASLSPLNAAGVGRKVELTTIDRVVEREDLTRLDCIKMDIQGAELSALRGASTTLRTLRPVVIMEYDATCANNMGWSRNDLDEFLNTVGYRVADSHELNLVLKHSAAIARS